MAKLEPQFDVLVLGGHPAAYLAAALVAQNAKMRVLHSTIPGEPNADRLVLINPEFFKLHPLVEPLRRKLDLVATYGLQFLFRKIRLFAATIAVNRRWRLSPHSRRLARR